MDTYNSGVDLLDLIQGLLDKVAAARAHAPCLVAGQFFSDLYSNNDRIVNGL